MERLKFGSVHGRFQPFHNGHLDYALQAFERADFVYVGVTKVLRPLKAAQTGGRDSLLSNPLSYWERCQLIEAALLGAGINRSRFTITPFPIEDVDRLPEFIPIEVTCFTTLVNEWNTEKIARLASKHYPVVILDLSIPDNRRVTSGTDVRRLLRAGDPSWARFVPPAVAELIATRLRHRF